MGSLQHKYRHNYNNHLHTYNTKNLNNCTISYLLPKPYQRKFTVHDNGFCKYPSIPNIINLLTTNEIRIKLYMYVTGLTKKGLIHASECSEFKDMQIVMCLTYISKI